MYVQNIVDMSLQKVGLEICYSNVYEIYGVVKCKI